eukprot:m.56591 g.56591  ORF g.56591 m.56591 type:complete len:1243 (+) comp11047_c0_seq2:42-3770(+)
MASIPRVRKLVLTAGASASLVVLYQYYNRKKLRSNKGDARNRSKKQRKSNLFKLLFPSKSGKEVTLVGGIAALCIVRTLLNDRLARLQGWLFKAAFMTNAPYFLRLLAEDIALSLSFSTLKAAINYVSTQLGLTWRKNLYRRIEKGYFKQMSYYKLSFVDKTVDNPEEVIVNDVETCCTELSEIVMILLGALIDGSFFTWQLARVTDIKWASVAVAYVFTAVGMIRVISPNFGKLYSLRTKAEAALRFAFSHFCSNEEAIAALGGDAREKQVINDHLQTVVYRNHRLIYTQWWFGMIEDFIAKYCVTTVAVIVIILPFFGKNSKITREGNAEILSKMRYITSLVIFQLTSIGGLGMLVRKHMKLSGFLKRVEDMLAILDKFDAQHVEDLESSMLNGESIEFNDVTVETPDGNELVHNLTFEISRGRNMLITGPNGAGKSSIFRCLGGLWRIKKGSITKPLDTAGSGLCGKVFYLPQKPYNVIGDLRDQLMYPATSGKARDALTDDMLVDLLERVELRYLIDTKHDAPGWSAQLSLGELQRLAMARLFYHAPTYAILDECTSAVSASMERKLYEICSEMNITCITISHRPALETFHKVKLTLDGYGKYSVEDLDIQLQQERSTGYVNGAKLLKSLKGSSSSVKVDESPLSLGLTDKGANESKKNLIGKRKLLKDLVSILWPKFSDGTALYLSGLVAIVIGKIYLSDRIAHINGHVLGSLLKRDVSKFGSLIKESLWQSVASAVLAPSLLYTARLLALKWRERLSAHMYSLYFKGKAYYQVSSVFHATSDSDQRITEDLNKLASELANVFPDVIKPIADVAWFTYQAYLLLGFRSTALLYLYMISGYGVLRWVTPDFSSLTEESQRARGDFRFVHTRLRIHAESVAFFGGDQVEGETCRKNFNSMMESEYNLARSVFQHSVTDDFIIQQLPAIVTWGLSFLYAVRMRTITEENTGAKLGHDLRYLAATISHTFLAFGELLDLYKRALEISGYASRVLYLRQVLKAVHGKQDSRTNDNHTKALTDGIEFSGTDIMTPSGKVLVRDLSCKTTHGSNLLITGPSGSGKSSIVRVLGGLWPLRNGTLKRPIISREPCKSVFLVPQTPYSVIGTLIDQITYPENGASILNNEKALKRLDTILESVRLAYLKEREGGWTAQKRWKDVLSLGEQQRLGMARLFYHKPQFAILDQCTDAISVDVEEDLYKTAAQLNISIITTSQRPALTDLHKYEVRIQGQGAGDWELWQLA